MAANPEPPNRLPPILSPFAHDLPAFFPFWRRTRCRLVDLELTPLKLGPVQCRDDCSGSIVGDFHKAKATALVRLPVEPNAGAKDFAERFNEFRQVGGSSSKGQVAKIQYFAHLFCVSMLAVYSVCRGCARRLSFRYLRLRIMEEQSSKFNSSKNNRSDVRM